MEFKILLGAHVLCSGALPILGTAYVKASGYREALTKVHAAWPLHVAGTETEGVTWQIAQAKRDYVDGIRIVYLCQVCPVCMSLVSSRKTLCPSGCMRSSPVDFPKDEPKTPTSPYLPLDFGLDAVTNMPLLPSTGRNQAEETL